MSHESGEIIVDGFTAHVEIPVIKKRCRVWQLIAGAFVVGLVVGLMF